MKTNKPKRLKPKPEKVPKSSSLSAEFERGWSLKPGSSEEDLYYNMLNMLAEGDEDLSFFTPQALSNLVGWLLRQNHNLADHLQSINVKLLHVAASSLALEVRNGISKKGKCPKKWKDNGAKSKHFAVDLP